jgi:hypothetical protein
VAKEQELLGEPENEGKPRNPVATVVEVPFLDLP